MSGRHVHGDKETIQRLVAVVMARMNREAGGGKREATFPNNRLSD
jgi:hypothetical protein